MDATGNVQTDYKTALETDHISAEHVNAEMVPKLNQPQKVTASGSVQLDSAKGKSSRSVQTAAIEMDFAPLPPAHKGAPPSYHPASARSLAPASVVWHDPASRAPGQERITRASGQRVEAAFDERNHVRHLVAHGNTELQRDEPGKARATSTSQDLDANFDAAGQWTTMDQTGGVQLHQGDDAAQSTKLHVDHATNLATLTGAAEANDAATHTTADTIQFNQETNDMQADGHVLTTYRKPLDGATPAATHGAVAVSANAQPMNLGPEPVHIMAERMTGNSAAGHATYTGHSRMWQGDSIIEADEIELHREARQVDARGNVRTVFLQAPSSSPVHNNAAASPSTTRASGSTAASKSVASNAKSKPANAALNAPAQPNVIRMHSGAMTYWDAKSEARLYDGFTGESQDGVITSQECELYFAPPGQAQTASSGSSPQQKLDHAIATKDVVVRQTDRHATGDRGDYEPGQGKFVLTGANPTVYDENGNSTRGRQLTFFLADDTIQVDSDSGSRVLTRYQVQK
jgi:lipopolysaccharide export system protein LptA